MEWTGMCEQHREQNAQGNKHDTPGASPTPARGPPPRHGPPAATAAAAALAAALAASRATAAAWVAIRVAVITMFVSSSSNGMVAPSPSPVEKPLPPPPASTLAAAADASAAAVAACAAALAASAAADCAAAVARSTATAAGLLAGMRGHPSSSPSPLLVDFPPAAPSRGLAPAAGGAASPRCCSSAFMSSSADSVLSSHPGAPLCGGGTSPHSSEASASAGEAFSHPMGSSMALGSAAVSSGAGDMLMGPFATPPSCGAATLLACPLAWALLLVLVTCREDDGGAAGARARPRGSHGLVVCCVATAAPWAGACSAGSSDWPPLKLRHRTAEARARPEAKETPKKAAHSRDAAILRCVVTAGRSHVRMGVSPGSWPGPGVGRTQSAPKTELRGAADIAGASPPEGAPGCVGTTSPSAPESSPLSPVEEAAACALRLCDVTLHLWRRGDSDGTRTGQPAHRTAPLGGHCRHVGRAATRRGARTGAAAWRGV